MNTRRVLPIVVAVIAIVSGAAGFVAYESNVVSITARVEERPLLEKQLVADPGDLAVRPPADCVPGDADSPIEVPGATCLWWVMRVAMSNPFDVPLENVMVTDDFGAGFDVVPLGEGPVRVDAVVYIGGQSENESSQIQSRITWCASGVLQPDGTCAGGQLQPGDSSYLDLLVYTKTDPSGQEEYREGGICEMDSGATAEWVGPGGAECSPLLDCPSTPSLEVMVLPAAESEPDDTEPVDRDETATPEATGSPGPGKTATPEATGSPQPGKTATPAPAASQEPGKTATPELTASQEPGKTATPELTGSPQPGETATPEPTEPAGGATQPAADKQ